MSESCLTPYHAEIACLLPLVGSRILARHYYVSTRTVRDYAGKHGIGRHTLERYSTLDASFDEIAVLYPLLGADAIADRYHVTPVAIRIWARSRGVRGQSGARFRWDFDLSRWIH